MAADGDGSEEKLSPKEAAQRQQQLEKDIQQATQNSEKLEKSIQQAEQERQMLEQKAQEAAEELEEIEALQQANAASNTIFTITSSLGAIGGIAAARQALSKREAKLQEDLESLQKQAEQQQAKLKSSKQTGNFVLVRGMIW